MELHPAVGAADGSIFCTFAAQKTIGNRLGPNPTFPTFDWTEAHTVKLAFDDLTKIQQVFRASASRSMATTGFGTAPSRGTLGSFCATSSTRSRATPLRFTSALRKYPPGRRPAAKRAAMRGAEIRKCQQL